MTPLSSIKEMVRQVCFLGTLSAEQGRDRAALELYEHAYRAGRKLLGEDPSGAGAPARSSGAM